MNNTRSRLLTYGRTVEATTQHSKIKGNTVSACEKTAMQSFKTKISPLIKEKRENRSKTVLTVVARWRE